MDTFHLHVEHRIGVKLNTKFTFHIVGKFNFIGVFNIGDRFFKSFIVRYGCQFFNLA